ncbi:MAG: YCF48-related protein [Pirellulaceae bacterium]|nr:YCF48-related protein [Pirellulaceae bacterium]
MVLAAAALLATTALAQPEASGPEMLPDAELTAITFLDADRGWAVGDRGVIWHTADGGRSWKLQNSGVACRLEAVQFFDANIGWVVGGWTQPYTHETHGVVLRTRDGGRTWQNTPGLTLPALTHAKFFDAKAGWAIGEAASLFPSGVFRTDDGGRTWAPVPKGETLGWVTGDFRDPRSGAVAGWGGTLGLVTANEIRPTRTPNLGSRFLRRMQLTGEVGGWLVGDGGLVLTTADAGFTWTGPPGRLPDIATSEIDFRALAVRGNHVWIAGAPGTCVVHSPDGGQTWETFRTDQTAPLRALFFLDEYRGWAVGALGTILHTRNGGKTWLPQHTGGLRAALLGIFSDPARVPLELVVQQAASEGYLTAVEILGRRDQEPGAGREELSLARRAHEGIVAAGGSAADVSWRFPLREIGLPQTTDTVLARWNLASDGQAAKRLEEHLVRRIRQWRPEVIVTEDVSPRGDNPLAHLTNQMTLAAVMKAGDPTAYSDQITLAGLAAWKVKKVFTTLPAGKQGVVNITPAQWSPRLGRSLADMAELGRGVMHRDLVGSRGNVGLALLVDPLPQQAGRRDVLSGILLSPGGEARRILATPAAGDLEQLGKLAQKRHNVEQLLAKLDGSAAAGSWLGQIDDLTGGLPPRQSGEILWQLAQRYHQGGQSELASDVLSRLVEKYPQTPLADAAALWLLQYYASGEMAWRNRRDTKFSTRLVAASSNREEGNPLAPAVGDAAEDEKSGRPDRTQKANFAQVGHFSSAAPTMTPVERAGHAIALATQVERTRPTLFADPAFRFSHAVAQRQAGQPRTAERLLQSLASLASDNPWRACALAEQWLTTASEMTPKKLLPVVTALQKPRLDGRLDDPLWQVAKPVSLTGLGSADAELPAAAVLAFDDEFLYLAISCRKAPRVDYAADAKPRPRDSDLAARDHVVLLLDIDRDYATYWRLALDHRGFPAESCHGDTTWNPQWFVAAGGDDQWWTAEAAIPLVELGPRKPQVRDVWAAGIQRVVPQLGLQAATQPAAIAVRPEGFGLMVFE